VHDMLVLQPYNLSVQFIAKCDVVFVLWYILMLLDCIRLKGYRVVIIVWLFCCVCWWWWSKSL